MKYRVILSILVFAFLLYGVIMKLVTVPITHDESWTIIEYTKHSVWDIIRYPDSWPNNHILNTLLAKFSIFVFGLEDWACRLPNLLAFFLFAFAAFRISSGLFTKNLFGFLIAFLLFFANPYMLDFFSLCRGYGLSLSFLLMSLAFTLTAFKFNNSKHAFRALIFATLSAYANFPSLVFWAAMVMVICLYHLFFSDRPFRKLMEIGLLCIGFLALILSPILKMRGDDQFKYWSSNGFFEDTILSSIGHWRYGAKLITNFDSVYLAYLLVLIYAIMGMYFIVFFLAADKKDDFIKRPFSVLFMTLSLTAMVNMVQCSLLNTPFLNGRTALLYYPLFVGAFSGFLYELGTYQKLKPLVCFLLGFSLLISVVHLVDRYDRRFVREWWYDANTKEVIKYIEDKSIEKSSLATNWIFHPSFNFYSLSAKADKIQLLDYSKEIIPNINADYYYVELKDLEKLKSNFVVEKQFAYDRYLLRRK